MEKKNDKLLEVRDLKVSFFTPAGEVKAVNGISYDVNYDDRTIAEPLLLDGVKGFTHRIRIYKHYAYENPNYR